jgi:hypothetical protein
MTDKVVSLFLGDKCPNPECPEKNKKKEEREEGECSTE